MASAKYLPINHQIPKKRSLSKRINSPLSDQNGNLKSNINQVPNHQLNLFQKKKRQNTQLKKRQKNNNLIEKSPQLNVNSQLNHGKVEELKINNNPLWLKGLMSLNIAFSCVTFILIVATLSLYGWTVYTQQSWGKAYRYLELLQRNERQLTATNEMIKNELAQEAENPEVGLVNPNPKTTIFLKPTDDKLKLPESVPVEKSNSSSNMPSNFKMPLGY